MHVTKNELKPTKYDGYFVTCCGDVISLKQRSPRVLSAATCSPYGHQMVSVRHDGKSRSALVHRLVWESFYGTIPDQIEIDHIDRNPKNNAIENLRLATRMQNARNCSAHKKSRSRFAGVTFHGRIKKWQATIRVNKKLIHLGYFANESQAAKCREAAAAQHFGEYAPQCD
jgi:hypothetical protein